MQCVSTFSHFDDSVLSLASNDPNLSTFYAGCKDGLVAKFWRRKLPTSNNFDSLYRGLSIASHQSGTLRRRNRIEIEENVDCVALLKQSSAVLNVRVLG